MECPSCLLRYNISNRRPDIIPCGHTLCLCCLRSTNECSVCHQKFDNNKNQTPNYSLMQILQTDNRQVDKYIKVCFVGSSMVGKTSLIKRLVSNSFFQQSVTTIGYDFSFVDRVVDNLLVRFQLWDSAGQQKYRAISPIHYKNADIVVIVYDVSQNQDDNRISYWIQQTLINCNNQIKMFIIGNKTDLVSQNQLNQHINQIPKLAKDQQSTLLNVSCKNNNGIQSFWAALDNQFRQRNKNKMRKQIQQKQTNDRKQPKSIKCRSHVQYNTIPIKKKSSFSHKDSCC